MDPENTQNPSIKKMVVDYGPPYDPLDISPLSMLDVRSQICIPLVITQHRARAKKNNYVRIYREVRL